MLAHVDLTALLPSKGVSVLCERRGYLSGDKQADAQTTHKSSVDTVCLFDKGASVLCERRGHLCGDKQANAQTSTHTLQ